MSLSSEELFSIGVEEEYQIIDPESRELCPRSHHILPVAQAFTEGAAVQLEFRQSQLEVATPICYSLSEVRTQLTRLRRQLITAAEVEGCYLAAAGTHPFSHWQAQPITPDACYQDLIQRYQRLMHELVTFGCHVHIGIANRELAIQTMNRVLPWLPPLLALSASSPFWLGSDTQYASYRTVLIRRLPMAGAPPTFASVREYQQAVQSLLATQVITKPTQIRWDIRPSERFATLEFRIPDMPLTVDETILLAGLIRGLVRTCYSQVRYRLSTPKLSPHMLNAAQWMVARWGLEADFIDVETQALVPAPIFIEKLLDFIQPALEDFGEWDTVAAIAQRTLKQGNGATRQRQIFHQRKSLIDVVDYLVQETRRDCLSISDDVPVSAAQLYKP